MKISYDNDSDTLYITFKKGRNPKLSSHNLSMVYTEKRSGELIEAFIPDFISRSKNGEHINLPLKTVKKWLI